MSFSGIVQQQRDFFNTNQTKDIGFRIKQLKKFKQIIKDNESLLYEAIYSDFNKSEAETYLTELSQIYHETNLYIKKIRKWSRRQRVKTNLANFPGRSYIIPEPLGTTLVIGAWNYPYGLSLIPALSALGAGNTVVLKPSEVPSNTSKVMAEIINKNFPAEYFHVIEGGVPETTALLDNRFDKIFFTGSTFVGRIIYQAAAKHLTPVTLELGGKSPTFVLSDANIKISAKRIAWAKFLNAGQTCVAPDYVLVDKSIEEEFLAALKTEIDNFYPNALESRDNYLQIVNLKNFDRLTPLIDDSKVYCGGKTNREKRLIEPTVLRDVRFSDEVMKDEIFGPILPVLSFTNLDEMIAAVKARPKPLACYIYSSSSAKIKKLLHEVSFGGGAVNDSLMHLANSSLPFGGVGFSGTGSYHGKAGFETFSHYKSVLHKSTWYEPHLKYFPYTKFNFDVLKKLLE